MSEYYEVYRKRAGHFGTNPQERALKSGKSEFKRQLHYSKNTVRGLRCKEKVFDGIILAHKQNELETSLKLYTDTCVGLKTGDMVQWEDTNWLVWYKTITAYNPNDKFEIIECKHNISWVDDEGQIHHSLCHIIGSQESKIKDNFRTWNGLITPQPNKFLEIIMPYQHIAKETEIIVKDEVWRLIEYDKTSVDGIIYLSFGEAKFNEFTDDKLSQLANADKQQVYSIYAPKEIAVSVGEEFTVPFEISLNGIVQEKSDDIEYFCGSGLECDNNGKIIATQEGTAELILQYKNAMTTIQINAGAEIVNSGFISGNDYIRITRSETYKLELDNENFVEDLNFYIDNEALATIDKEQTAFNTCVVKTNSKNKLGSFILSVEYKGIKYEKEIRIISLWKEI